MSRLKKNNVKRLFDIIAILLVIALLWIIIKETYFNPKKLKEGEVAYTAADIVSFKNPSDGNKVANFVYEVDGKNYEGFFDAHNKNIKIGNRFFLKFLKSNPEISDILLDMPVSDSLDIPNHGWDYLP